MRQLRFTTTAPHSMFGPFDNGGILVDPEDRKDLLPSDLKGTRAYIHNEAEDLAGFDIPSFIDGDMGQLDLPVEQQNILMMLPSGNYQCQAKLQTDRSIDNGAYYITLRKRPKVLWGSVHALGDDQKADIQELYHDADIIFLKDLDEQLYKELVGMQKHSNRTVLAWQLIVLCRDHGIQAVFQPSGDPLFHMELGCFNSFQNTPIIPMYFSYNKRISEDYEEDGVMKKISTFKHEGFIEFTANANGIDDEPCEACYE